MKRCHFEDINARAELSVNITRMMKALKYDPEQSLILLCIGTDRSTGDALGPLTGKILWEGDSHPAAVYGRIENPVHGGNLKGWIEKILAFHNDPFIVSIDAGLGKQSSVGYIDVREGPLRPGTALDKDLPKIGDMHITGLVNVSGYVNHLVLQTTRLSIVMRMADVIAGAVMLSIADFHSSKRSMNIAEGI